MTRLVLIRHGETSWNLEGRYQGQADPPLDERGYEQAAMLAAALERAGLDVVYSSPLRRASETATVLAHRLGLDVRFDGRLMEISQGDWEGQLRTRLDQKYPALMKQWDTDPWSVTPPGGESLPEVRARVYAALDEILSTHEGCCVGLVTHRLPIVLIKMRYQGLSPSAVRTLDLPNTSWEEIEIMDKTLTTDSALTDDARQRLERIGAADIIVGIPSYNNAATIRHVVGTVGEGLTRRFPDLKAVIMDSDGGSTDDTPQLAESTGPTTTGAEVIAARYQGIPGKGSALRAIFEAGRTLGVKACLVVDSDLQSITPEWIELLARPVLRLGYGYVAPLYTRHKYDGTITNNIVYPLTRMLYGIEVRQPIGGDFGMQGELLQHYLSQDVWSTNVARFGIDVWMTTTAINAGYRICQAQLGVKVHDAKDPGASLGPMFEQVVGTLFAGMGVYENNWKQVQGYRPTDVYGHSKSLDPEPVAVNLEGLVARFASADARYGKWWDVILRHENREAVRRLLGLGSAAFEFPAELWASIVVDYAVAYNKSALDGTLVLESMTPLYYGRTAGMVRESADMDAATFEREIVQAQAQVFQEQKMQLITRWEAAEETQEMPAF